MTKLRNCGQLLPPDSQFVMELSANWNTQPDLKPGEAFGLSFTFADENRPELVGEVPDELYGFARCLSQALTDEESAKRFAQPDPTAARSGRRSSENGNS